MRYDYPQIAAFESRENTYRYEVPDPSTLDCWLSSTYKIELDVIDFWIGVEMLTRQMMVYVWTRGNKLKLSICYNESFYARDLVERFLESTKRELVEGLGI